MYSVCAVIVTLNPDLNVLSRVVNVVSSQVDYILIVDNNSTNNIKEGLNKLKKTYSLSLIMLDSNNGVAKAHNIGIAFALKRKHTHVLILDQDSIPYPNMVNKLLSAYNSLKERGIHISAVGPLYINSYSGHLSYFVTFRLFGINRKYCPYMQTSKYIYSDFLISSGCIIPLDSIKDIGMMDENLFIDHVDTEWFIRAKHKNYYAYGVCDAFMEHNIGEKSINIWLGRKKEIGKHNPERLYYNIRNSLLFLKNKYCSISIKLYFANRAFMLFLFYFFFVSPRLEYLKYTCKGIKDAFRGVTGKIIR